ncbi:MAG: PaaI family thioesterase [Clostridiales Family XIII bacterium]|jgi:acyl-CoA thioesterase|nr:PaaI family thioesterase [Clostridiales Family XIII bacterium]
MDIDTGAIREIFKADRFATKAGALVTAVSEDMVECAMDIDDSHMNAANGVQGGAIFTLADLAFAVHANLDLVCGADVGVTLAQSCAISFLRPPKGRRLIARSSCISKGRTMSVYRVRVEDELGNPVAEMQGNGFRTRKG